MWAPACSRDSSGLKPLGLTKRKLPFFLEQLEAGLEAFGESGSPLHVGGRFSPGKENPDFLTLGKLAIQADAQAVQAEIKQFGFDLALGYAVADDHSYFAFGSETGLSAAIGFSVRFGKICSRRCHGREDYP